MTFMKLDQVDLDYPRQDLSNGGLEIFVALLVCPGVIFSCVYGRAIQLYGLLPLQPPYQYQKDHTIRSAQ